MRCPVCRADNERGPSCRRCRADLAELFALEGCRSHLLAAARCSARAGRWDEALERIEAAHALRRGSDTRQLLAVGRLMVRQFAAAWQARAAARADSS